MDIFGIDKKLQSSFSATGLKQVNSDRAFETLLKRNGIDPKDLARIEKEDAELWDKITGSGSNAGFGKVKIAKKSFVVLAVKNVLFWALSVKPWISASSCCESEDNVLNVFR